MFRVSLLVCISGGAGATDSSSGDLRGGAEHFLKVCRGFSIALSRFSMEILCSDLCHDVAQVGLSVHLHYLFF